MNDPIATLMNEHRLFERIFAAFERWADGLAAGGDQVDVGDLDRFLVVLSELVDQHHHGKEEDILFKAMLDAGFPAHGGPIAVMLHEHDEGRSHVRALRTLTSQGPVPTQVVHHVHALADLMRAHIQKEDHILYPMATRILGDTMTLVGQRCHDHDHGPDTQTRVLALWSMAEALVQRYG